MKIYEAEVSQQVQRLATASKSSTAHLLKTHYHRVHSQVVGLGGFEGGLGFGGG